MKDVNDYYTSVAASFRAELVNYMNEKTYVSLQYFSDIREYLSVRAVIAKIYSTENGEFILLNTSEEIRLDRIIRIEGKPAPGFEDYFACAC